jgi:UDP-glucose 4-epimerase
MPNSLNGQTVLITGAAGFYGQNLLSRLSGSGAHVVSVCRDLSKVSAIAQEQCKWVEADLADRAQTDELFRVTKPSIAFHLTSASLGGTEIANVRASIAGDLMPTLNILESAARSQVGRVVLPCSMEEPFPAIDADSELAIPETPYALSKLVCGLYGRFFRHAYDLPVVVVRCFLTYGPHQKPYKLIPYVIRSLQRGEAPKLSSGTRLIDWVYVDDLVSALIAAATVPQIPDRVLEIGTGELRTIREVVTIIRDLMGGPEPVFGAVAARGHERAARIGPALSLLNWTPKTSIESGLRRTIQFYTAPSPAAEHHGAVRDEERSPEKPRRG